jgi:hypothetical protein
MPMYPVNAESTAPTAKPNAVCVPSAKQGHEQHCADNADCQVLAVHIRIRAFLNRLRDRLHAFIASWLLEDPFYRNQSVQYCQYTRTHGEP